MHILRYCIHALLLGWQILMSHVNVRDNYKPGKSTRIVRRTLGLQTSRDLTSCFLFGQIGRIWKEVHRVFSTSRRYSTDGIVVIFFLLKIAYFYSFQIVTDNSYPHSFDTLWVNCSTIIQYSGCWSSLHSLSMSTIMYPDRRRKRKLITCLPVADPHPHGLCYFRLPEGFSGCEFFSVSRIFNCFKIFRRTIIYFCCKMLSITWHGMSCFERAFLGH